MIVELVGLVIGEGADRLLRAHVEQAAITHTARQLPSARIVSPISDENAPRSSFSCAYQGSGLWRASMAARASFAERQHGFLLDLGQPLADEGVDQDLRPQAGERGFGRAVGNPPGEIRRTRHPAAHPPGRRRPRIRGRRCPPFAARTR
ncbi:MAG: hypothetical protein U0703_25790 [Anaerolineae bacterium]